MLCIGDYGDSGSLVYDQDDALWEIYEGTYERNSEVFVVIPIDIILENVYKNENVKFDIIRKNLKVL